MKSFLLLVLSDFTLGAGAGFSFRAAGVKPTDNVVPIIRLPLNVLYLCIEGGLKPKTQKV
jgi:hypothetical protein